MKPPLWCKRPFRYPGSTRVPSSAIVKMRTAFLATDRGIASCNQQYSSATKSEEIDERGSE